MQLAKTDGAKKYHRQLTKRSGVRVDLQGVRSLHLESETFCRAAVGGHWERVFGALQGWMGLTEGRCSSFWRFGRSIPAANLLGTGDVTPGFCHGPQPLKSTSHKM